MQILDKIGEGLFSEIKKCILNEKEYAIKMYKECPQKLREREIKILSSLSHKHIITIVHFDPNYQWFVTELLSKDLYTLVQTNGPMTQDSVKQILLEMSDALTYLHSIDYVHRDIKLENVMMNQEQKLQIIDFGLAVCLDPTKTYPRHCGTQSYMAPELNQDEKLISGQHLKKTDVFALGVLIFILTYGYPPFSIAIPSKCKFWLTITQGKWQAFWNYFDKKVKRSDEKFRDLIQGMLEPDPKKRMTMEQVRQHNYLTIE